MLASSNQKYAIASLLVIALSLTIDYFFLSDMPSVVKQEKVLQQNNQDAPKPTKSTLIPSLRFENISLPPPPPRQTLKSRKIQAKEQFENKLFKHDVDVLNNAIDKNTTKQIFKSRQARLKEHPSDNDIKSQYAQLGKLSSANLRLSFPDDFYASMRILNYMHQCVGIGIGAFDNSASPKDLTFLGGKGNNKRQQEGKHGYSKIVRFASGIQTKNEQALLQAYAPGQQLVRLYPLWFDHELSGKIASQIGTQSLSQLSGTYVLKGNTLFLANISLNQKSVEGIWVLSHNILCGG
jgi:hypothetical protein